jgi:hypothetical protein
MQEPPHPQGTPQVPGTPHIQWASHVQQTTYTQQTIHIQGTPPPSPEPPPGFFKALGPILVVAIFVEFMFATAGVAMFPGLARMAGPFACPSGTQQTIVERSTSASSRGGQNIKWDLYCIDASGFGTIPEYPPPTLVLWLEGTVLVAGMMLLGPALRRRS